MSDAATTDASTPAPPAAMLRLSIMMFLQFFVWGAWYVSMTGFINAQDMSPLTAAAYTVGPIAAIISPFFLGMVADRFFPTQGVLGAMHVLGGVVLCLAPLVASPFEGGMLASFGHLFTLVLLLHMLCYMPTIGLSTSLAFHNLTNAEKQFPMVRVWGTIGWIIGNIAVGVLFKKTVDGEVIAGDQSAGQFYLAGGAAILLGLYSFTLPHTPPPAKGKAPSVRDVLGLDSLALFKKPSYTVFIVCSFLLCIPLAGYYAFARNYVEATGSVVNESAVFTMSFGQMSEILFMLVMPFFFVRLGVKWMLAVGMLAWVMRYGLFAGAAGNDVMWMVLTGVILHGICYDFFFVTGMIYVDRTASKQIRSQAQGFLVLVTQGLGLGIGAQAFGWLVSQNSYVTTEGETAFEWFNIWLYPAVFAGVVLVAFVLLFRERGAPPRTIDAAEDEVDQAIDAASGEAGAAPV